MTGWVAAYQATAIAKAIKINPTPESTASAAGCIARPRYPPASALR